MRTSNKSLRRPPKPARVAKTSASGRVVGFNYALLDPDIAKEIRGHTRVIKGILNAGGLAIGKRLIKVKDRAGPWSVSRLAAW